MSKIPVSVTILTKDNGKTLEATLESVKDFDEIIVCDGGSSDGTLEMAKRFGAKIIAQDPQYLENGKIFDFAGLHNQMVEAAKHNWIFSLDSDEKAGPDMATAMREVIRQRGEDGIGAFWVNRKYVLNGTVIDCAATYPNRQMRFFSKNSNHGWVKRIHERIKLKEGVTAEFLGGYMYLPFYSDIAGIRKKWDYQISVAAAQAHPMSPWKFLEAVGHCAKVSLLWFFRLARNAVFCSGTKMPLKYEMERHYFHLRLIRALWGVVHF